MIAENIKMALRSLAANKLRTFLTMLGMIIGVGAVVAISSIGQGLKAQISGQVNELGANVIFIIPGQVITTSKSGHPEINPTASIGTSTLTENDIKTVSEISGIKAVGSLSLISGIVTYEGTKDPGALIMATTTNFDEIVQNPKVSQGRGFETEDFNKFVAILGPNSKENLFGKDTDAIGKTITIRERQFTVIGITAGSGGGSPLSSSPGFDEAVFIPKGTVKDLTGTEPQVFRILAKANSENEVKPAVEKIKTSLKNNHGGQEDFSVLTQDDLLSTLSTILGAMTSAITAIAAIALLVGGIGIMNMMLVTVTERTREVGLRKAVGATSYMVLSQFLIEAIVLSVIGGMLGVGLAYLGSQALGKAVSIVPIFSVETILVAFGVSVLIGIIFGIAPAIKAARMKPIEALRYE